ncbi:Transferase-like protein 1 [Elsinoe fawcettii]|nr:Transferase-like protein 1 [Elsinoe fawcettii]
MVSNYPTDFSHLEDVLGNWPFIRKYIVLCTIFEIRNDDEGATITSIREALNTLAASFPWLAAKVVIEGKSKTHTGIRRVLPHKSEIELVIKDLQPDANYNFGQLQNSGYPFSMIDPAVLAPSIAVTWGQQQMSDEVAPVLSLQANLITGGLILTFIANHTIMDMTGLGMVIALFAKACRGEAFTDMEIKDGNQDRRQAVTLLGHTYQPGPELNNVFAKPDADSPIPRARPRWAYWNFSAANVARLKEEASKQDLVPYISTDDAIAALCWQRIAKVRSARLGENVRSFFARPCSMRSFLGLKGYIGQMVDTLNEDEVDVWKLPVGQIAGRMRRMLQQNEKITHHIKAVITMVDRLEDKSVIVNGAGLDPNRDFILSSYANIKCCDLSFGPVLGQPDAARRPRMPPWPSLCYLMPKSRNGEIAVAVCLGEDDIERLKDDDVLTNYGQYLG